MSKQFPPGSTTQRPDTSAGLQSGLTEVAGFGDMPLSELGMGVVGPDQKPQPIPKTSIAGEYRSGPFRFR